MGISLFVMLSLSPLFRRQWPSLYEALQDGRPQRNKMMRLYIEQIPTDQQPVLAGDHTNYPRLDAKTLKDRTYEHQPTSIPGNKPVTIGQGYSTIAWVPEGAGSWALPLRHERITSFESPISKAVFQLKQVSRQLSVRPIVLYETQGITDFAIKIYMLAQIRAIANGEEAVTEQGIRLVAKESLRLAYPILQALKNKDTRLLASVEDVHPIDIDQCLQNAQNQLSRSEQHQASGSIPTPILTNNCR